MAVNLSSYEILICMYIIYIGEEIEMAVTCFQILAIFLTINVAGKNTVILRQHLVVLHNSLGFKSESSWV